MVLYVDPGITPPWCFVNAVAAIVLPWFSKICLTDFPSLIESDLVGIISCPVDNFINLAHFNDINNDTIIKFKLFVIAISMTMQVLFVLTARSCSSLGICLLLK